MEARAWERAASFVATDVVIDWPSTGERFRGSDFLAMQRAYPEGWSITVHEAMSSGDRVAARVNVDQDDETYWCAGFYTIAAGVILAGVEYWVTGGAEQPPPWRASFTSAE